MQNPPPTPPENPDKPAPPEIADYDYNEFTGEITRKTSKSDNSDQKSDAQGSMSNYARYSSLGFQMIAAILLGVLGGIWLDKLLHSSPWLTLLGTLLGVALSMYIVIKEATRKP